MRPLAAVLIMKYQDRLLLEVRAPNISQPGEVCFPGGKVEAGESTLVAVVRESCEELGLSPQDFEVKVPLMRLTHPRPIEVYFTEISMVTYHKINPAPAEVAEIFWLPLSWLKAHPVEIFDLAQTKNLPTTLQGYLKNYPPLSGYVKSWQYKGRLIWGLTAQIIQNFLRNEGIKYDGR